MYIGQVIGKVVSTQKHESYQNQKILMIKPMLPDGQFKKELMIAVDTVGAGEGDRVLVASEGRTATEILQFERRMPLRSVIVGIIDHIDRGQLAD